VTVPDVISPGLRILFVGVNPGICSGRRRHHFAHPTSRLWKALHESGFMPQELEPAEEALLLEHGLGLTNLVDRPTRSADQLRDEELRAGALRLRRKASRYRPAWIAILGVVAYRVAFSQPDAVVGPQLQTLASSRLWVLPGVASGDWCNNDAGFRLAWTMQVQEVAQCPRQDEYLPASAFVTRSTPSSVPGASSAVSSRR
jgi:TDG/mug DNA glycosylase family protein